MNGDVNSDRNMCFIGLHIATLVAMLVFILPAAYAQSAGMWMVKGGYNQIIPRVSSGNLTAPSLPGAKVDVGHATGVIFTIAYMLTDNLSAELFLGTPYKHDLVGEGALQGVGKIGTIEQLPPTLFFQYRFRDAASSFRPYAGLGVTFAVFRNEVGSAILTAMTDPGKATTFKVDSAWGLTPQIGVVYALDEKWFVDAGIAKSFLKTTAALSTGQRIDVKLNPVVLNLSLGYRF